MRLAISLILTTLLTGCGLWPFGKTRSREATRESQVRIEWLGHQCFRITSSLGITVVTDPFDPKLLSYPAPKNLRADIVLVSHEDSTANHTELLNDSGQVFRSSTGVGSSRASGLLITGIPVSENAANPYEGLNTVYTWRMDGVRFCHLGAVQRVLTPSEATAIGRVDVLFLPIGDRKLPPSEQNQIIAALRPRILVPMSYRTPHTSKLTLNNLGDFVAGKRNVVRLQSNAFTVSPGTLSPELTILVPNTP